MPNRMNPLPPRSLLRLKKLWPHARKQGHEIGETRRVGYYSPKDGLDYVWLVNDDGEYDWASDHEWIWDKFEIVELSDETDLYGDSRPRLGKLKQPTHHREQL